MAILHQLMVSKLEGSYQDARGDFDEKRADLPNQIMAVLC